MAHEVGHAVAQKLETTPEVQEAILNKIASVKEQAKALNAQEAADALLLPEVSKVVKIPENATVSELTPTSKKALLSEKEYLANQVAAIMLKRAGKDIGNYEILPEVEIALARTRLPDFSDPAAPPVKESPISTEQRHAEISQALKVEKPIPVEEPKSVSVEEPRPVSVSVEELKVVTRKFNFNTGSLS